jgi:PAS domain S-box-containing protein
VIETPTRSAADQDQFSRLLLALEHSPIAQVVSNPRLPDNPLVAANAGFCALTGYSEGEILGRNCRFLAGPATESWLSATIRQGVREKRPVLVEILNYKRDGTPFRNAAMIAPIFDAAGELAYFIGSQVEIGADVPGASAARRAHAAEVVMALSKRQREILKEIAAGFRTKQIAHRLSLSEKTVKMHRSLLLERLRVSSAADAIRLAVEAGL